MDHRTRLALASLLAIAIHSNVFAKPVVVVVQRANADADGDFKFADAPQPAKNDAASTAEVLILNGRPDPNGGAVSKLHDGQVPFAADEPAENFFFNAGDDGGGLLVDLGRRINVKQINTYSWHPTTRGPQVYALYASDGGSDEFERQPGAGVDPAIRGWRLLANVDTRSTYGGDGGPYAVSISVSEGILGEFRYVLFIVSATEQRDPFGNTFFSEIDVVASDAKLIAATPANRASDEVVQETVETEGGKHRITIDTTEAPDLTA